MIITHTSMQDYYRDRYVADLKRSAPDIFIDTVVSGAFMWHPGGINRSTADDWTENDGYESEPALRDFVDRNYVQVKQLRLRPDGKPVRFFARVTQPAAKDH
jgi:hypothetical protein